MGTWTIIPILFYFFKNCIKWQTGRRNVNMSSWTGHSSRAYHSAQIIKAAGNYCETVSMRLHRPRTGKQHREQPSGKQHLASSLWTEQQESKPGAGGSAAGHHTKQTIIEWATIRPYTTIGRHNWNSGDCEATENTLGWGGEEGDFPPQSSGTFVLYNARPGVILTLGSQWSTFVTLSMDFSLMNFKENRKQRRGPEATEIPVSKKKPLLLPY